MNLGYNKQKNLLANPTLSVDISIYLFIFNSFSRKFHVRLHRSCDELEMYLV